MTDEVKLCRRCGERPGRERFYVPRSGEASLVLTVGCDPCWAEFEGSSKTVRHGYPVPWWLSRDGWGLLVRASEDRVLKPIARGWQQVVVREPVPALAVWLSGLGAVWLGGWEDPTSAMGLVACGAGAGQALRWALRGARWPWQRD